MQKSILLTLSLLSSFSLPASANLCAQVLSSTSHLIADDFSVFHKEAGYRLNDEQAQAYLDATRHEGVALFLEGEMRDEDVPKFMTTYFPEVIYLTGQYNAPMPREATTGLPSERVFGEKHLEFDRTLNAIMFLKWAHKNDLEKITANQAEPKLSQKQLDEIRVLIQRTLKSQEDWDAMITYMAIHDAAKTSTIATDLRQSMGSRTEDHDALLLEALEQVPGFAPSFDRLSEGQKAKIIAGMRADFNMGQFNQGENLPGNLSGLRSLDKDSTDFYLVHVLADIAGVLGNIDSNGAKLMNSNTYNGFSHGISALGGIKSGASLTSIYRELLSSHADSIGFDMKSSADFALMRLGVLMDVRTQEQMKELILSFGNLAPHVQARMIQELNKTGIEDKGVLIYYFPAFLKSLKGSFGIARAIDLGLPIIDRVYSESLPFITSKGIYTTHITALKDLAAKSPDAVENVKFHIQSISDREALLVIEE